VRSISRLTFLTWMPISRISSTPPSRARCDLVDDVDVDSHDLHTEIRVASAVDAPILGRRLRAFNVEFGEETPTAEMIAERAAPLIASRERADHFANDWIRA
jgi:hypothetical protein